MLLALAQVPQCQSVAFFLAVRFLNVILCRLSIKGNIWRLIFFFFLNLYCQQIQRKEKQERAHLSMFSPSYLLRSNLY